MYHVDESGIIMLNRKTVNHIMYHIAMDKSVIIMLNRVKEWSNFGLARPLGGKAAM